MLELSPNQEIMIQKSSMIRTHPNLIEPQKFICDVQNFRSTRSTNGKPGSAQPFGFEPQTSGVRGPFARASYFNLFNLACRSPVNLGQQTVNPEAPGSSLSRCAGIKNHNQNSPSFALISVHSRLKTVKVSGHRYSTLAEIFSLILTSFNFL